MEFEKLSKFVQHTLEEMKAVDITSLDVRGKSSMTDKFFFATGNSTRHVRAIAQEVVKQLKEADFQPLGVEGMDTGEWVLVDLNDIIVHVMTQKMRDFYELEKLWQADDATDETVDAKLSGKQAK